MTLTQRIYRRAAAAPEAGVGGALAALTGATGAALPEEPKARFQASLGTDLSAVRVHTDAASASASAHLGARAFATGNDIHFAAGAYQPDDLGSVEDIGDATSGGERVTACLGVHRMPGWRALQAACPVDVVGVFAPVEYAWSEAETVARTDPPSADAIATQILAEEAALPRDPALEPMRRFYRRHRLRAHAGEAE